MPIPTLMLTYTLAAPTNTRNHAPKRTHITTSSAYTRFLSLTEHLSPVFHFPASWSLVPGSGSADKPATFNAPRRETTAPVLRVFRTRLPHTPGPPCISVCAGPSTRAVLMLRRERDGRSGKGAVGGLLCRVMGLRRRSQRCASGT